MENFIYTFNIDPTVCDQLIQYHTDNIEYKSEGKVGDGTQIIKEVKESVDVTFYNNSNHGAIKNYFNELQKGYVSYVEKYNLQYLRLRTETEACYNTTHQVAALNNGTGKDHNH